MASDPDCTPATAPPKEHHRDPPRNCRNTQGEPDAKQAECPRPPCGKWNTEPGERGARNLRPECVARACQSAFQNELEALADLREGDHPQIQYPVGDHLWIGGKE